MSTVPLLEPRPGISLQRRRFWRPKLLNGWASRALLLAAMIVAGLVLLPPIYLLMRTIDAGPAALNIFLKPATWSALGRTLLLTGSVTIASIILAVPIAWLTVCTDLPKKGFWMISLALPLVLPSFVVAYLMASIFGPRGLLQQLLLPITGLERLPAIYGFPGAFLLLTLMCYPYILLTVGAALRRRDPSLIHAARSLGSSPWQTFWRITLPQLRPAVVAGALLVALYVLRDFGAVSMMRYDTFTRILYIQYQSFMNRSVAAALALILVLLTVIILAFELKTRTPAQYSRLTAGAPRKPQPVRLGKWRWPALIFLSGILIFALVIPVLGLSYWLIRGLSNAQPLSDVLKPAFNSFGVSSLAAVVTLFAALPVAYLSVRGPSQLTRAIERVSYLGHALPGIVIALALVFFGVTYVRSVYQTLIMLVVAYVLIFIPHMVGSLSTSIQQLPTSLEEAGRSLGRGNITVFRRITAPLVRYGVFAGMALVFLSTMKELPATLILGPTGFRTLPTVIWANISEAFFAQAALPTLLLILLSSIPLALLIMRDE